MKSFRTILILLIVVPALGGIVYYMMTHKTLPFESVCDKNHQKYTPLCENVGKRAYSLKSMSTLNETDYGPILGVAWRSKDSTVSSPGQEKRYSPKNSYYYIMGSDNSDYVYLRMVDEVDPR